MPAPLGLATIATLTLLHPVICEFSSSFHLFRPVISFFLFPQQCFEVFNLVLSIHIVATTSVTAMLEDLMLSSDLCRHYVPVMSVHTG